MPSHYDKNIIGNLRGRFDPHYKLASNVEGIEKGLGIEVAQIHKTLSKSFAMQRKTLVRVLGLEKRVNVLELEQAEEEQAKEGIDEILENIHHATPEEVAEYNASVPMTEAEKEFAAEESKFDAVDKAVATKKKLNVKKTKITGEAFKKGTVLDDGFKSRVLGQDEDGEYLSAEERKARFKGEPFLKPDALQPVEEEPTRTSSVGEGLKNILNSIAGTTESIKNILIGQQEADRDAAKDAARETENVKRAGQEKKLETKLFDGVKKVGEKVLKPVQGLFQKIWGFVKKVLLADIVRRLFNWLSDDDNKKKVGSIFRFVKDFWPALLTGFLLFGTGIGSLITGTVGALASFIPTLVGMLPGLLAFLASPIGLAVLGTAAVVGGGMWVANKMKGDGDDKKIEGSKTEKVRSITPRREGDRTEAENKKLNEMSAAKGFNKGGSVPGKGNTDTVPAMLTPGEFVLTKEATEKYGTDTLESMNAAAATGKDETSGTGRLIGSTIGGFTGAAVGFFADTPVSPAADIALGIAGSAAGGEIGDNVERKVRGMNKGGKVLEDDGLGYGISGDTRTFLPGKIDPNNLSAGAGEMVSPKGASVVSGKEKEKQEAWMLEQVNKERAFMGIEPPLKKITYSQGVYLAKAKGPGPRTKEYTSTNDDFDTMTRTTTTSKWVEGKGTTVTSGISQLTEEDREKYFAKNPYARIAANIKNQSELDALGADISASAKPQKFNKGGLVQEYKKLRMERSRLQRRPDGTFSRKDKKKWNQLSSEMSSVNRQIMNYDRDDKKSNKSNKSKKAKGLGLGRMLGGAADFLTGNLTDFDGKGGKTFGASRILAGAADALTGNRWDFDKHGKPAKVAKSKPKHTEIAPPSISSRGSGSKPGVTAINAGGVGPTIDATNDTPIPEVPVFSAVSMRSPDKIKTLGIMV